MTELDRHGIPVHATPTGRRRVWGGRLYAELRRGPHVHWPFCRPHEDCVDCAIPRDHDSCPTTAAALLDRAEESLRRSREQIAAGRVAAMRCGSRLSAIERRREGR